MTESHQKLVHQPLAEKLQQHFWEIRKVKNLLSFDSKLKVTEAEDKVTDSITLKSKSKRFKQKSPKGDFVLVVGYLNMKEGLNFEKPNELVTQDEIAEFKTKISADRVQVMSFYRYLPNWADELKEELASKDLPNNIELEVNEYHYLIGSTPVENVEAEVSEEALQIIHSHIRKALNDFDS